VAVLEEQLRVKDAQISLMQASIDRLEAKNTRKRKRLEAQAQRIDTSAKAAKKSRVALRKALDLLKVRPRPNYLVSSHTIVISACPFGCRVSGECRSGRGRGRRRRGPRRRMITISRWPSLVVLASRRSYRLYTFVLAAAIINPPPPLGAL
jgi:hypothetical protein